MTYIKPLDGLRALAVLLVVAFHLAPDVLRGGYAGVSVFFVLSGFLITSLLLAESSAEGRIDLKKFYGRRLVRLTPALLATLALALLISTWISSRGLMGDEIAGATYTSDFWALTGGSHSPALGQLWSLAVEEQFYLLWPLLLSALLRLSPSSRFRVVAMTVVLLAVIRAVVFQSAGWSDAYFLPQGSAVELMTGAGLALLLAWKGDQLLPVVRRPVAGVLGLGLILGAAVVLQEVQDPDAYRGGLLLVGLATAVVIAHLIATDGQGVVDHLLTWRLARWAGRRSYGIYLYHLAAIATTNGLDASRSVRAIIAVVITLVLAEASWQWIETPASRRYRRRFSLHIETSVAVPSPSS